MSNRAHHATVSVSLPLSLCRSIYNRAPDEADARIAGLGDLEALDLGAAAARRGEELGAQLGKARLELALSRG